MGVLPKNPSPSGDFADTPMGAIGFAISGGHIYNHLANPDGSVAWYDEIQSLDLSMGHSDPSGTYHYHGVPYLISGASGENQDDYQYDEAGFADGTCHLDRANGRMFD